MNIKFITLGCKVNQYETQAMREEFLKRGFTANDSEIFQIALINSCSVTAESDRKTRQTVSKIRRENPDCFIVLTGCSVQVYPKSASMLDADVIIGNTNVKNVVDITVNSFKNKEKYFDVEPHDKGEKYNTLPITAFDERTRAFMKIEDGCNRFCSYCIIPYARGRVRSRDLKSIKEEAENLSKNGFSEIVLVGINLSAYGNESEFNLCDAVDAVCSVNGIKRVRLGSLEPDHITDNMLERFKAQEKFCPQFHLSLQSGCDETLKRMNRHYDSAFYFDLVTRIRKIFPDAAITTDIMVGFAGESEEEFNKSFNFVKKVGFARAHIFAYSRREGTVAAALGDQVTNSEKSYRSKMMIKATKESEKEFLSRYIGKTVSVLFERNNEGYTKNYSRVILSSDKAPIGEILDVYITDSNGESLIGNLIKNP